MPDFITNGVMRAVVEAEQATGIEAVKLSGDGIDVRALARLVAATRRGIPPQEGGKR